MAKHVDTVDGQVDGARSDDKPTELLRQHDGAAELERGDRGPLKGFTVSCFGLALTAGVTMVAVLVGLAGWLGYRLHDAHRAQALREQLIQAARQGAINLTTIDYKHVEADVQRVLDCSSGKFRDDFKQRSEPFIDVVKQAQSTSQGTVTAAGLESQNGNQARVVVAVTVHMTNAAGAPEQRPRGWRMRITVQRDGDAAKMSEVQFVP